MIERRPRAPVSRSIALSAIASSESGAKTSSMSSNSKSRWNCLVSALRGSVRIVIRSSRRSCVDRGDDRQAADELGDQAVLHQVLGQHLAEELADVLLLRDCIEAPKPMPCLPIRFSITLSSSANEPPQMNRMFDRVDRQELLVRVLAPALRRHRGGGALEDLQQRLLHALAGDVARDRRVVGLARDLVDLVDVDDPGLGLLDVVVGGLDQLQQDVLDVLADVAGLGQRRRVGDRERDVEDPGQRLGEQRLAAAGRAEQQDVRLLQLDRRSGSRRPRRPSGRACSGCRRRPRARAWRASWPTTYSLRISLISCGLGSDSSSKLGATVSSSSMISLQRSMHSSQM